MYVLRGVHCMNGTTADPTMYYLATEYNADNKKADLAYARQHC